MIQVYDVIVLHAGRETALINQSHLIERLGAVIAVLACGGKNADQILTELAFNCPVLPFEQSVERLWFGRRVRMMDVKTAMTRAAMNGLYHASAHRLLAPYTQGAGVIFTLNHVRPTQAKVFAPNRDLEVAPDFLEAMLDQVEQAGLDVVSLDEAVRRLREDDRRRFVCFTFNHGYRNTLRHAYPLFQRRSLPFTLYIATDYASGWGELWWLALEEVVARAREIELCRQGGLWRLPTITPQEKQRSFAQIYEWLRSVDEARQRQVVRALAELTISTCPPPATN